MFYVGDTVGSDVGDTVGSDVGDTVGSDVGDTVGSDVGDTVGSDVGDTVDSDVGDTVGSDVGDTVGSDVGDVQIPESVVSPGIALAISAMAFPSSCIRDTTADGYVGINEGADMKEEEDKDHYFIMSNSLNDECIITRRENDKLWLQVTDDKHITTSIYLYLQRCANMEMS